MSHLRNQDYTDRELLHIVHECSTEDGYAHTSEIAERVYGDVENANGERRYVGSRMAWMVRYEFVARDPDRAGYYKLTPAGRALMEGKLRKPVERALSELTDGDRALVLRAVARDSFSHSGPQQDFFRREYTHHFDNRERARKRAKRS